MINEALIKNIATLELKIDLLDEITEAILNRIKSVATSELKINELFSLYKDLDSIQGINLSLLRDLLDNSNILTKDELQLLKLYNELGPQRQKALLTKLKELI